MSEGQVRGYLGKMLRDFKGHGKELPIDGILEMVAARIEDGPPYLGAYFLDFGERDLETLLQCLKYDKAVAAANAKKASAVVEEEDVTEKKPVTSAAKQTKSGRKKKAKRVVPDEVEIDPTDI